MKGQICRIALALAATITLATLAPAAAQTASGLPAEVVNVVWEWVGFVTPVEEIEFDGEGHAAIQADCNRGTGGYTVPDDGHIAVGPIALTRMMCESGSLADRFTQELGRATTYFLQEDDLFLELPVDSGTLQFRRQESAG
jgi:heat shock protein HslJ